LSSNPDVRALRPHNQHFVNLSFYVYPSIQSKFLADSLLSTSGNVPTPSNNSKHQATQPLRSSPLPNGINFEIRSHKDSSGFPSRKSLVVSVYSLQDLISADLAM
jgi:hypothetical protein